MLKVKPVIMLILLSIVFVCPALLLPTKGFPGDKPAIVVEPAVVQNSSLTPGSTFLVNVSLYNATNAIVSLGVQGVEAHLQWDNSTIQPLSFVNGLGVTGGVLKGPQSTLLYGIDAGFYDADENELFTGPYNDAVSYEVAAASRTGAWWGNGFIATITFTVLKVGSSVLNLTFTAMKDANAATISHYEQNGYFDNTPLKIVASPSSASLQVGQSQVFSTTISGGSLPYQTVQWKNNSGSLLGTGPTYNFQALQAGSFQIIAFVTDSASKTANSSYIPITVTSVAAASVFVSPASMVDSSLTPGSPVQIYLNVSSVTNLASFSFSLSFNASILNATSAVWSWNGSAVGFQIDNSAGFVNGSTSISPTITGKAALVTVTFNVTGVGTSSFHFVKAALVDNLGSSITASTTDGYFNNVPVIVPPPTGVGIQVDPQYRSDPTLRLGNTTTFSIVGENFASVAVCRFDLSFDPSIVGVLTYTVFNPIGGSLINVHSVAYNNTFGSLNASFTYKPALSFTGNVTLMNITFILVGYGITWLNLTGTTLTDPSGNSIPHTSANGELVTVVRDVAIVDIQPYPLKVYPGRIVTVNVTAANLGTFYSETFTVTAYVDTSVSIGTQTVTNLAPGANITLSFSWNTARLPTCQNHTLSAQASFVPSEINTANNFLTSSAQVRIKIVGDINGDGIVDLGDLTLLANTYPSYKGNPNYNPDADFNNDGSVDISDLVTLAVNWHKTCG